MLFRIFFCLIAMLCLNYANAQIVRTTGIGANYGGFQSNLNINRPKTIIASHTPQSSRYYNRHRHYNNYQHLRNRDLAMLEKYALNKTYKNQNDLQRLERLENLAFGATQYGDLASRYRNVEAAILSRPSQQNIKSSIVGNLANYLGGQLTGFTPNLSSDNFSNINPLGGYSNNFPT